MQTDSTTGVARGLRVLVVVRDRRLRDAIDAILHSDGIEVVHCASVAALGASVMRRSREVVLLDWSKAEGLLTEAQRDDLRLLCRLVQVVLLVPDRWSRLLKAEDLGVARVLPKGCESDTLLATLASAAGPEGGG